MLLVLANGSFLSSPALIAKRQTNFSGTSNIASTTFIIFIVHFRLNYEFGDFFMGLVKGLTFSDGCSDFVRLITCSGSLTRFTRVSFFYRRVLLVRWPLYLFNDLRFIFALGNLSSYGVLLCLVSARQIFGLANDRLGAGIRRFFLWTNGLFVSFNDTRIAGFVSLRFVRLPLLSLWLRVLFWSTTYYLRST